MKTKEELNKIKEEVETVSRKLHELSDDELTQVIGGCGAGIGDYDHGGVYDIVKKLLESIKELKEQGGNQ